MKHILSKTYIIILSFILIAVFSTPFTLDKSYAHDENAYVQLWEYDNSTNPDSNNKGNKTNNENQQQGNMDKGRQNLPGQEDIDDQQVNKNLPPDGYH